ncbi:anti-sigma-I factor RsgI family protein [Candidatus Stoquefichus massiliensis]|uniref:anti-sigma-I factor RsgI family protein n=1 Tax=Candidatus Stoquefichus massiliensis TaxID=1470350 RepID=UPI00048886B7|nr:PepSY domain-containing protein [Candidatus Stoquefichus massiliensis]
MNKLYDVFEEITPDRFESIQAELIDRKENVVVETNQKRNYKRYALALVMIASVIVVAVMLQKPAKVIAVVGIDVNPSIELSINQKNKIEQVTAKNEDAKKIIGDMDLKGSQIDVGINALIGAMLKEGYIDELKNSLLISVTGDNQEENEKLRKQLSLNVDEFLKASHIDGSVVSQTIDQQDDIIKLAKQYNISVGKAEIIQQLIVKNSLYTFDGLKDLSVNELNILLQNNHVDHVNVTGQASVSDYIGQEKAKKIAFDDAKVSKPTMKKIQLDYDDGQMIYEVEFTQDGIEYEYDIQAKTGKILKKEMEGKKKITSSSTSQNQTSMITKDQAKKIAMNHAGVKSIQNYQIKEDIDNGQKEYDIEFLSGNYQYEYTIRVKDGRILENEKKNVGTVKITAEQAKQKALDHANISKADAKKLEAELEKKYYEVSFTVGEYEYEYHIDALNGKVLHHEKEKED